MRLKITSPIEEYYTPKGALYVDGRCYVHKDKDRIICVFAHFTEIISKSQREWLFRITDKLARRELGEDYKIVEHTKDHYHLIAEKHEKTRKTGKNKSRSKPKTEGDIQG